MLKHALSILAVAAITLGTAVVSPSLAEAKVNVYTTPGRHVVDGRHWNTTCAAYDARITRCRAEIKSGGQWVFNNLSYLATDRADWYDNPLARPGRFISSGREWITSCNDGWTGRNACRSFIRTGGKWVFNNLVYFTPGTIDYPKFTFHENTGGLTAEATPSTRYSTSRQVLFYKAATGPASNGTLRKGTATIVTQRELNGRSEVFHDGIFAWIATDALVRDGVRPTVSPTKPPVSSVPPKPSAAPVVPTPSAAPVVSPKPPVAPATTSAGALPVGTAKYDVPADSVFVTAGNSRSGSGTESSPYRSLAYAIEKASSGMTIVMRGGNYHEATKIPFHKNLTVQSYPGEAVWLDGSSVVTGWRRSGSAWMVSDWNYIYDHRVSHSQGVDESNRFIDPRYPLAGYPDQVWVSDAKLRQVGTIKEVVPGTFFVDESAKRLYVGSDPTGKKVEASTLQQGLVIQGAGSTIRGIGARRYGNTFWMGGAISAQVDDIVLENVVSSENATIGINGWGKRMRFNQITVSESGALGIGLNKAHDLVLSNSFVAANNNELFKQQPVSGGVKITGSDRVVVSRNLFEKNHNDGLWFDVAVPDAKVIGNTFADNQGNGLQVEWSTRAVVSDNYFVRNRDAGIFIVDSTAISVWNNTFQGNEKYSIRVFQDTRRSSDPVFSMLVRDVSLKNNVLSYGTGSCPYLVDDYEKKITGQSMRITSEGNAFHRSSATSPANMACWANGSKLASFKTLSAFRSATGNDLRSTLNEGASILTNVHQLTPAALASTSSVALPVPGSVASVIGIEPNSRKLGAISPMVK